MQVLTASQSRQIRLTVSAAYDALIIVEDAFCHTLDRLLVALTSERAIGCYRTTYRIGYHAIMLSLAAIWFSGVATWMGCKAFQKWADGFIAQCEDCPVESTYILPASPEPVALLEAPKRKESRVLVTPAPESEIDIWEGKVTHPLPVTSEAIATPSVPLLPPAKIEPQQEQVKKSTKKRGRPRKAVA